MKTEILKNRMKRTCVLRFVSDFFPFCNFILRVTLQDLSFPERIPSPYAIMLFTQKSRSDGHGRTDPRVKLNGALHLNVLGSIPNILPLDRSYQEVAILIVVCYFNEGEHSWFADWEH